LFFFDLILIFAHIQHYTILFFKFVIIFWVSGYKLNGLINFIVHLPNVCFILF